MDQIGHIFDFEISASNDGHIGTFVVSSGRVVLKDGTSLSYNSTRRTGLELNVPYTLSIVDTELAADSSQFSRLNRYKTKARPLMVEKTQSGDDKSLPRGVYEGGIIIIGQHEITDKATAEIDTREAKTYLNIIGALISLILEKKTIGGVRYTQLDSQASLISVLEANFPNVDGIKKRTMEDKFAAANKSLKSD